MVKQNVYIIGSKGIPARYGGFETFVEKLTEHQQNSSIQYHVACMKENSAKSGIHEKCFSYNGADCFNIDVPSVGPARAIYYDIAALNYSIDLAKKNKDIKPIFYVLACRIGPFIGDIKKKIKKLNGKLFVNPDGHEWLRAKWSYPIKKYWKYSEKLMVKYADLLVCDSKNIENYIHLNYKKYDPQTVYIAYGADLTEPTLTPEDSIVNKWYRTNGIERGNYYLIVGRFVPENNYEAMIKGFMQSSTMKDLVIITDVEQNKFYQQLKKETKFDEDIRIKFVGTVYDQELLKYIRKNAFAYIHGHEVGGTNPSLLEALYFTRINLLLNVGFNREVGDNAAYYWNKKYLAQTIDVTEQVTESTYDELDRLSSKIIIQHYTWEKVVQVYQKIFLLWS